MTIVVCGAFVAVLLWAVVSNPDLFSPAKFFLFSFLMFHLGALADRGSPELWLLILVVLMVGGATVMLEALSPLPRPVRYPLDLRRCPQPARFVLWIWALSLPALLAQAFLVWKLGGLTAYVSNIGNRVIDFRGLGWAVTLSATMATFNLAYFGVGLTRPRGAWWWCLYAVHLLLTLVLGLLSGSRGGTLNIFAMQLFCYHYIKGNVRVTRALPLAVGLLAAALVLGLVRNNLRLSERELITGLGAQHLEYGTFQYGVTPLRILLNADGLKLAHGSTLLSVVTNLVPRPWWPDKPDTGGVFFTKAYTGNAWNGASNLTPTLLGEGIINFGWVAGIALYVCLYPALMCAVVRYYRRIVIWARRARGPVAALELVLYVSVMWAVVGLMIGELTTTLLGLLATKLLPLLMLRVIMRRSLASRQGRAIGRSLPAAAMPRVAAAGQAGR
jgi:hypothetical protein